MNRSSNATYATPGWRGTDPDGGTWVRLTRRSGHPWLQITPLGEPRFRTQEEAEAAGLVPLVPQVVEDEVLDCENCGDKPCRDCEMRHCHDGSVKDAAPAGWLPKPEHVDQMRHLLEITGGFTSADQRARFLLSSDFVRALAAPAPLDPGNPEHLRQVADVLGRLTPRSLGVTMTLLDGVLLGVRSLADRLDRERAEVEQAAADRKLAEDVADEVWSREESAWHIAQKAAQATLVRIRAERARASAEDAS
ncbi:hypothetical protein [Tsukamurella tyrosinosolvens]|uniref:hypothetical protein n=1 Tax=Tsukamurella tyrosinosolvens TaxID=57704 RepID=UPI0034632680